MRGECRVSVGEFAEGTAGAVCRRGASVGLGPYAGPLAVWRCREPGRVLEACAAHCRGCARPAHGESALRADGGVVLLFLKPGICGLGPDLRPTVW
eukprot:7388143-Prymnesium_polylepis.2